MKSITKSLAVFLALTSTLSLGACGSSSSSSTKEAASESVASGETVTLKVGASPAPHAEILQVVAPILAADGIKLEIVEFTDYIMPNKALEAGDLSANYFQHLPYLENFNTENKTDLISATAVHFEPLGLYPGKTASIEALAEGGKIAVPNDATNEARALLLLQDLGMIKLKDGKGLEVGLEATPLDIVENPKKLEFIEMEAAQVVNTLKDVDLAVINGNYAVSAKLDSTVLASEDKASQAAQTYANIIAVRKGDETSPEIQKLVAALKSDEVKKFINEKYNGVVIPVF